MAFRTSRDTMPKLGHVTDLREQWLVREDGALAHHLQDREISSHLCENRYRNQQIREDFPVAVSEQRDIEHEAYLREMTRRRQADIDAEIAREMAEINLRKQRRRHSSELLEQPGPSRPPPPPEHMRSTRQPEREWSPLEHSRPPIELIHSPTDHIRPPTDYVRPPSDHMRPSLEHLRPPPQPSSEDLNPEILGLSASELEDMRRRLEQEERDARLARQLSHEADGEDALLALDMKYAVEAQDGELARLLQEREYKKLQRSKEKARQKALLKKQQRLSQQQNDYPQTAATLVDAYSNPRDMIRENGMRLCKSVDSDLNYVEPFEKEHIQSRAGALQAQEVSRQWYGQAGPSVSQDCPDLPHRLPPPVPAAIKKPRFPDPVSIRPASHYPADDSFSTDMENNNSYSSTFPPDHVSTQITDQSKRLSVVSDITAEGLIKKRNKQEISKKKKGCKIQ